MERTLFRSGTDANGRRARSSLAAWLAQTLAE
jgi:hypothetical protein